MADATHNSTQLVLKPRYQRKLAAANATAARKRSKKGAKPRARYQANAVTLSLQPSQPSLPTSQALECYFESCRYKSRLGSLTGSTLVAAEDLAQRIKKHVKFAGSQSLSATSTLAGAPTSVSDVRSSQDIKITRLPPQLQRKYYHDSNRNYSRSYHRQHQKWLKHSFNYHTYSDGPPLFPDLKKANASFETLKSWNDTETSSMFQTVSVSTEGPPSTETSTALEIETKLDTSTVNNKEKGKANHKRRRLAHIIASPVLALSPVFKRAGERVRNHDAKKDHVSAKNHHAPEKPMSLPKILFKPQSTLADAVHKVPGQTDAAADYGDRVSDESERLSSLVALVTPYLEACLGDIPTVPNPNVTAATDHKSQLEMILESQTSTPITSINALVVEHLLFNFGKLQVREFAQAALPEQVPVSVAQQDQQPQMNPQGNAKFLYSDSNDIGVGGVSSRTHSSAQLEHLTPTSFSSACSTKYIPSSQLLSSNLTARKLDGGFEHDSASTSPYDDVEFLW